MDRIMQGERSSRLVPRVGDNLDRLLDLLDRARAEQEAQRAIEARRAAFWALITAHKSA